MTGRDLIIYIMQNQLENTKIFTNHTFLDFVTIGQAAVKMGVGTATITTWISRNELPHIQIGDIYYIPRSCLKNSNK